MMGAPGSPITHMQVQQQQRSHPQPMNQQMNGQQMIGQSQQMMAQSPISVSQPPMGAQSVSQAQSKPMAQSQQGFQNLDQLTQSLDQPMLPSFSPSGQYLIFFPGIKLTYNYNNH